VWCGGWVRKQTPSSNVIFFMGDRVDVSENSIIDRLSQPRTIASILVSKLGSSVNVWVVEPSHYKDSFACYENLLPSLSPSGEPSDYKPRCLPAARATLSLLQNCLTRVGQFLTCNPIHRSQVPLTDAQIILCDLNMVGYCSIPADSRLAVLHS
jgi:hypothetical protein